MTTKTIVSVACKARDLTDTLSESIRLDIHKKLDELIRGSQRCPYVLTEAGEEALLWRLADDVEPMLSHDRDTREDP